MVKVSVVYVTEKEEVTAKRIDKMDTSKAKDFEVSELESVSDNLERAVMLFELEESPNYYALQVLSSKEYLVETEDLTKLSEGAVLLLQVSPVIK
jgi:hypothetical protein